MTDFEKRTEEEPCPHEDVREALHHALAGRGTHTCLDCGAILTVTDLGRFNESEVL